MDEIVEGEDRPQALIGWPRAIATALIVALIGLGLLAYGTNALLTKLTGLDRSQRVGVSTAYFIVVLAALGYALRRLQQRGVL